MKRVLTDSTFNWFARITACVALAAAALVTLGPGAADAYLSTNLPDKTWYWQNPAPQGNQLLSTSFTDAQHGWAVGAAGTVLRTDTGGRVWDSVDVNSGVSLGKRVLRSVYFLDDQHGWIVGDAGTVRITLNGGASWASGTSNTTANLNDVYFTTQSNGWAVSGTGQILRTTDGGMSWTQMMSAGNALNAIRIASDGQNGWAVGINGIILRTTNGGTSWSWQTSNTSATLRGITILDGTTACAVGDGGTVRRTTDGGTTWTTVSVGSTSASLNGIECASATDGWIVGQTAAGVGGLWHTTNGGVSWTSIPTGTLQLWGVAAVSTTSVVVVGDAGTIATSTDSGMSWTERSMGSRLEINSVVSIDATRAIAVGDNGLIRETTGTPVNGNEWHELPSGTNSSLYGIDFFGSDTGWVAGANGTVRTTTDGGATWTAQVTGTGLQLNDIDFRDASNGWIVGANTLVLKTANGGASWQLSTWKPERTLHTICFGDTTNGWLAGDKGWIYRSTDGGADWVSQSSGVNTTLYDITMQWNATQSRWEGWVVGASGVIRRTVNGGTTWTGQTSGTTGTLRSVHAVNPTTAYITGDDGLLLKTADGGVTWTSWETGVAGRLNDSVFVSTDSGWVVGEQGAILRTTSPIPAPETFATVTPGVADGLEGWYVTTPEITLQRTKPGITYYRWSASDPWTTYVDPIDAPDGEQTLSYYSVDSGGEIEVAKTLAIKTDTIKPTVPASPVGDALDEQSLTFSWSASTDDSSGFDLYAVYMNGIEYTNTTETSITVSGLIPNTVYSLAVRATDNAGNVSALSTAVLVRTDAVSNSPVTTIVNIVPTPPDGTATRFDSDAGTVTVTPTGWYTTVPTLTLDWINPLGAKDEPTSVGTYYTWEIDGSEDPYAEYSYAPTDTLTATEGVSYLHVSTHDEDGVAPDRDPETTQTVEFKVDTVNPESIVMIINEETGEWLGGLGGIPYGLDGAFMFWPPITRDVNGDPDTSGVAYYNMYLDDVLVGSVPQPSAEATQVTGIITGISANVPHNVFVAAVDAAGNESTLAPKFGRVEGYTRESFPPPAPVRVVARSTGAADVYVAWETTQTAELIEPVSYHIWRSDGENELHIGEIAGRYNHSFVDVTAAADTTYYYWVATEDYRGIGSQSSTTTADGVFYPDGDSDPANDKFHRIHTSAPVAPRGLVSSVTSEGAVGLQWSPPPVPNLGGYVVYRSLRSGDGYSMLATSTALSYVDEDVIPYQRYWYTVASVTTSGTVGRRSIEVRARAGVPATSTPVHTDVGATNADKCRLCHVIHDAASEQDLLIEATSRNTCLSCHGLSGGAVTRTPMDLPSVEASGSSHGLGSMNTTATTALTCASCHDTHGGRVAGDDLGDLLLVEGETEGNPVCYGCHGPESALEGGDLTAFEGSGHNAQLEDLDDTAGITCLVCHETHGSTTDYLLRYDSYNGCFRCHSPESPSDGAADILSRFSLSGDSGAHHDVFKEDQEANGTRISCANCHNTHSTTEEYPLVDPNNPSPDGEWTAGTDSIAEFCFRCHDGLLPTAAQTGSWVLPPLSYNGTSTTADIKTVWDTNVHGYGMGTDADLRPDMGWLDGAVVSCDACHARHGAVNSHNLRGEVPSADELRVVSGAMVYDIPEALGGGHDLRFFCVTCHDLTGDFCEKHIVSFPTDCTECHTHIGGGL